MLRLLFLGDIVGEPGRKAVIQRLPQIKKEREVDFVVVNGENAAGGRGITPKICIDLLRAGAAVVTLGDHAWDQKEVVEYFPTEPRLLRPLNYPDGVTGQGSVVLETSKGKVGVINVQGRTFMQPPLENPFVAADREIERMRTAEDVAMILVDFHAEATSEKVAMGRWLDGKVSVVVGTHTHVQTADEVIFPGGTAYLTDAGMCGPSESVIGRKYPPVVERFRTGVPQRFPVATGEVGLRGLLVTIDETSGRALALERFVEDYLPR